MSRWDSERAPATQGDLALSLQRQLSERLMISALRESDAADASEESRRIASFLATEGRRLDESLDKNATLLAIAEMTLPHPGSWSILDIVGERGVERHFAAVHSDPSKQAMLDQLRSQWMPAAGEGFGIGSVTPSSGSTLITGAGDAVRARATQNPEVARLLKAMNAGALVTVPLVIRGELVGAQTYVSPATHEFTAADLALSTELASRASAALDRARLYGTAVTQAEIAGLATEAKSVFLGMVSHELRTPLNAIGGYVDLLEMEIPGPINDEQRVQLGRIRTNQQYLAGLINDLLSFTKIGSGETQYAVRDVAACDIITDSTKLVETLTDARGLVLTVSCPSDIRMMADPVRTTQILVNLLSNAIKFTPVGGMVDLQCVTVGTEVHLSVTDTGIGIPTDKLEDIFSAFIQVRAVSLGPEGGIGLGLTISRGLAKGMGGSLAVESTPGKGSRFTLKLPASPVSS